MRIFIPVLPHQGRYTTAYGKNINIGTAAVTVTGKGRYTGSITKEFTISAKKGTVLTAGSYKYKITGQTEAAFAGLKNRNATAITIPATVKIGGKNFKVTSIASKACYKAKIRKVTIGANIKNIGVRAFEGCDKLTTVTIKSADLKSVGKNALKGISRTARIRVPSAKLSVYGKLLRNKGQGNRVKIRAI